MSTPQTLQSFSENSSAIIFSPGELDSDEPPLESNLHLRQILLLIQCLEWFWQDRDNFFAAGNLTIYTERQQQELAERKLKQLQARLKALGIESE